MLRLIAYGMLAALFFSSTFIINRAMSLEGGSWVWSGALRFFYMVIMLIALIRFRKGGRVLLRECLRVFWEYRIFWLIAGFVQFFLFYAPLCYAADHAPGWVVAVSWQLTIIASPLVLVFFGKIVPREGLAFSAFIFLGILIINLEQLEMIGWTAIAYGFLPVLFASLAYPVGNQMVHSAEHGGYGLIPHIQSKAMQSPFARVLMASLGSLPFWIALILATGTPTPYIGQFWDTAVIAILSGVLATSIFLEARHRAHDAYTISAVDATQSGEAVFTLIIATIFLDDPLPGIYGWVGILIVILGISFYSFHKKI